MGTRELPEGWVWTRLGEICLDPQYGWTTSASTTGEIQLLRTTDITPGKIDWTSVPFCKEEPPEKEKYLLKDGDIVISRAGSVGYSHLVKNPRDAVFASYLIRFKPLMDEQYLAYFLKSPSYWNFISEKSLGIAIPNVNASKLKQMTVPLPPSPEQRRIVTKIEELFTRLDAGVEALKKVKAELKRYRQSVLKAAMEGKLTDEWREAHKGEVESASVLLERIKEERKKKLGKKYKELAPVDTSDLPELPEGWDWASVELLAASEQYSITDGPFGSNLKTSHYTESGPRVIRLQNIGDGEFIDEKAHISKNHFETLRKYEIHQGDLVIAALGVDVPHACIIPGYVGPAIVKADCIRFKPHHDFVDRNYVNAALNAEYLKKFAKKIIHGVGRPRLNQKQIKFLPLPLPCPLEQLKIVEEIESRLSVTDNMGEVVDQSLKRAERLRQSILKKAFEGNLVPQDPDDEPVSVLLEQMKIEKAKRDANGKARKKVKKAVRMRLK